ncbi:MAG: glycosyltransferase family 4 protein [Verrucomicrobia bacterium]|nr:glycosyltransferase family 4 protein [Verrucomicrobiota bacterium]
MNTHNTHVTASPDAAKIGSSFHADSVRHIAINGWQAGMGAVGLGVYTNRLLQGLARHLNSTALSATVLAPTAQMPNWAPMRVEPIPFKHLRHPVLDVMAWNHRLLSDRRLYEKDTVFFSPGALWGVRAPRGMAIVYHDCIYRHFPVYFGRLGYRRMLARLTERYLHRAQVVFTESHHARDDIAEWTGVAPEKFVVIPAWLPPEFTPEAAALRVAEVRARYNLPPRYWLYIGGYDVRKNVEFLIRAYAKARTAAPCPPLALCGRIPQRTAPTLCDVAGARRETQIEPSALLEPGFIEDADLPALYAGSELLIFPSLMEGYGLTPLEAMGVGCPAIVADNSSLREVVRDAEYRFDTASSDRLTDMLISAAGNPLHVNPSFRREDHDEKSAMHRYLETFTKLGSA